MVTKLTKLRSLKNHKDFNKAAAGIGIILFATVGTILFFRSHAATLFASLDLGTGSSISPPASVIADGTASGNSAVQFGSVATPGSSRCPAYPAMPDASCTGVPLGVTLAAYTGPSMITTAGTVIDGKSISSGLTICASNVTVKRSIVYGRINTGYSDADGCTGPGGHTGILIEDAEIDGQNIDPFSQSAIGDYGYTCRRCNVHGTGRGASMSGAITIEDSYFHDFHYVDGAHVTAVGSNGNAGSAIVVRHSNLVCNTDANLGCSAALSLYGDYSPIDNVTVDKNLFNTKDGGYCTYGGSVDGKPFPNGTNILYTNNRFGRKYNANCGTSGPVTSWAYNTGNIWSGNVWDDTGLPQSP